MFSGSSSDNSVVIGGAAGGVKLSLMTPIINHCCGS